MPRNKAAVEAFHNGGVGGGAGCMCYTCHKLIRNPGQIVPCERCVLPFCSAKCMAVHRMDARECDLRAKIREGGGIVGLGNAGKQTAGAVRERLSGRFEGEEVNSLPMARPGGVALLWRW